MTVYVEEILEPILRDMRTTGVPVPSVRFEKRDDDHRWLAVLIAADGTGQGCWIDLSVPPEAAIAAVADSVQEWEIEQLQTAGATNWPSCPLHPTNHPLSVKLIEGSAVWACPFDGVVIAAIGSLTSPFT